jgi:beta-glucosidase
MFLQLLKLGTQSGNAIAQVLYGDYNPSGKLPMTFPEVWGKCPLLQLQKHRSSRNG